MSGQKIVITGVAINDKEKDIAEIVDSFRKEGMEVQYLDHYDTTAGQGGNGGRTDVVLAMTEGLVKAALHPWHLVGIFRWAEDYFNDSQEIVPVEKHCLFIG